MTGAAAEEEPEPQLKEWQMPTQTWVTEESGRSSTTQLSLTYQRPEGLGDVEFGNVIRVELAPQFYFDLYRFRDGSSGFSYERPTLETEEFTLPEQDFRTTLDRIREGLDSLADDAEEEFGAVLDGTRAYLDELEGNVGSLTIEGITLPKEGELDALFTLLKEHAKKDGESYALSLPFTGMGRGTIVNAVDAGGIHARHTVGADVYLLAQAEATIDGGSAAGGRLRAASLHESSSYSSEGFTVGIGNVTVGISEHSLDERLQRTQYTLDARLLGGFETERREYRRALEMSEVALRAQTSLWGQEVILGTLLTHTEERINQEGTHHSLGVGGVERTDLGRHERERRARLGFILGLPRDSLQPLSWISPFGEVRWRHNDWYDGVIGADLTVPLVDVTLATEVTALPRVVGPHRTGAHLLRVERPFSIRGGEFSLGYEHSEGFGTPLLDALPDRYLFAYQRGPLATQLALHELDGELTGGTIMAIHDHFSLIVGYDTARVGGQELERLEYQSLTDNRLSSTEANSFLSLEFYRNRTGGVYDHRAHVSWHYLW